MTQATICNCGFPFGDGDVFCGNCGNQRVLPAMPTTGARHRLGAPFFAHAAPRPPRPMSNATRYLCAAAYLDSLFANRVIRELVGSHRAVVPSRGIDLIPIVRHCLKARKMQLVRDVLLCVLLLIGLFAARGPLVLILIIALLLGFLPRPDWERKSFGSKTLAGVGLVMVAVVAVVVILALFAASKLSNPDGRGLPLGLSLSSGTAVIGVLYACAVAGTLLYYCYHRNRTLGEWLSPGAEAPPFERSTTQVENRLAEIDAAQYGNLTLYSSENPFLGNGYPPLKSRKADEPIGASERAWSVCIELNREGAPHNVFDPEPRGRVRIDPVELHSVLRKRLIELDDPNLP